MTRLKGYPLAAPKVVLGPAPMIPGQPRGPRIHGGGNTELRDHAPAGGLLVGFEAGLGKFLDNDIVVAVRPVYRVGDKEVTGELFGTDVSRPVKTVAKPGYAVGAVAVKTGLGIDGFSVTYMKVADGKLDPKDGYEGDWVGGMGGGPATRIGGDGTAVVGILGKANDKNVTGLGLVYTDTAKQDAPWPAGKPTPIRTGGFDTEFRDGAPEGGLLVGLEIGLGKFFDNDVVRAVRPVYRTGDKETTGEQRGTELARVVKLVAKPGYAVGALNVKTGLGVDGLSVMFMKVTDGKLDPRDNYESEWVGTRGNTERVGGDGTPVVGVVGKTNHRKDVSGLGLLLKSDPKK